MRVLEASGLIEMRVGAHGGAYVTSPSRERLGEGMADLLTLCPLSAATATEARLVIELAILPLAVERATTYDISALFAMVEDGERALADGEYSMAMSAAFHVRVAACTHNPALEMLVHSFHGPVLMSLRREVAAPFLACQGTEEHRRLVEAIQEWEPSRASTVLRRHLERTARVGAEDARD
jgi:DNA-binding FadR family transcriptional regulator